MAPAARSACTTARWPLSLASLSAASFRTWTSAPCASRTSTTAGWPFPLANCSAQSLRVASRNGHLAVVEILLAHGANVHAGVNDALHLASENGHVDVVQALRAAGATE